MNSNKYLATPANKVNTKVATAFFNHFIEHYKVGDAQKSKAWDNFEELKKMDISLSLALNTAIALARI